MTTEHQENKVKDEFPPAELPIIKSEAEDTVLHQYKALIKIAQKHKESDQRESAQQIKKESVEIPSTTPTFPSRLTPPSTPPASSSNLPILPSIPSNDTPNTKDEEEGDQDAVLVKSEDDQEPGQEAFKTTSTESHASDSHLQHSHQPKIQPSKASVSKNSVDKTFLLSLGSGDARWGVLQAILQNKGKRARPSSLG
ncbi:hypothetical protein IL306_004826 [Fusarium sp. DS 682]|nr:hypothetical protein IL306_004826 [Fusarium sp. DS 682]